MAVWSLVAGQLDQHELTAARKRMQDSRPNWP